MGVQPGGTPREGSHLSGFPLFNNAVSVRIAAFFPLLAAACSDGDGTIDTRRGDTVPPGAVLNLAVERISDDSVSLRWTSPGDDAYAGRASAYELRHSESVVTEATWPNAVGLGRLPSPKASGGEEHHAAGGLAAGRRYFALKSADEDENWSAISNVVFAELGDTIPPATVDDLAVFGFDRTSITLTWTAPGDDGRQDPADAYRLRHSTDPLSELEWETATEAEGTSAPAMPGNREQLTIQGLEPDQQYYFALKTVDDGGNLSGLSNVVSATTVGDTIPPADVTDLEVVLSAGRSVHLRWTAPGDNGSMGQAAEYDLRHSSSPIDELTWESAERVSGLIQPAPAGGIEAITVTDLQLDTEYHFALRATDRAGNVSDISNVVIATTSSLVVLTSSPVGNSASSPDWEPNGDRIAFAARWTGTTQVHVVNAQDRSLVQITSAEDHINAPAWSPDGSVLACGLIRFEDSRQGVGIVGARPGSILTPIVIHESGKIVSNPSWSPDGDRIAYQVSAFPSFLGEIFVVDRAGGSPQPIVPGGSSISGLDWSPDGSLLVYSSDVAGSYDLWTISVDGGAPARLTSDDSTNETQPAWSPDGARIAFVSDSAGERNLWIVATSGGPPAHVTFGPVWKRSPCWSPTGDALACEILHDGRTGDIAIVYLP